MKDCYDKIMREDAIEDIFDGLLKTEDSYRTIAKYILLFLPEIALTIKHQIDSGGYR